MGSDYAETSTDWLEADWEAFMSRLPEIAPIIEIACLLTPDQEFISINEEAAHAYGMEPGELVGQKCYKHVHDQDEPIDECPCLETLDTGASAVGEVFEENGRYYLPATAPIHDTDGELKAVAHTVSDVTEQQESLRALERQQSFLEHIHRLADVGGWEFDPDTETLQWTDGTRHIHEVPDEYEPTVEDVFEFYHPEDRDRIEQAFDACRTRGIPYDLDLRIVTASGNIRWIRATGQRIEENGRALMRGAIRDITDRKHREHRLDVLNRVLRHNLRNSTTVINGHASYLADELTDEELQAAAATVQNQAERLMELSEKAASVRAFLRRESDDDTVSDLRGIFTELAATVEENYPDADVRVDIPEAVSAQADERLERALLEAVDNAVVHNNQVPPEVTVTVTSDEGTDTDECVIIEVADNGPGIPAAEQAVMEFGGETSLRHGSGLGLWLIHSVVTSFGGEVQITDNEPRGTILTLRLPMASG